MDGWTYDGHQYGRKYVLLVLSSLSSASSILNGDYIEGSGLCVIGSCSFEKDNTFGSIKNRSGSVGRLCQMKALYNPKTTQQTKYFNLFVKIPAATSERSERSLT